jgi:Fic family protein
MNLETTIKQIDNLCLQFSRKQISTESLLRTVTQFRLDWNIQVQGKHSGDYGAGATKQILIKGLANDNDTISKKSLLPSNKKIILIFEDFIQTNLISRDLFFEIHKLLIEEGGKFRTGEIVIGNSQQRQFSFVKPKKIEDEFNVLIEWFNEESKMKELHPVLLAGIFHYRFLLIHPFADGNGRIARIMTSMILLSNKIPPPILKENDRLFYLQSLRKADSGDIESWISFLGERIIFSMEMMLSSNFSNTDSNG